MMTREEAINRIKDHMAAHHIGEYPHIKLKEALDMALTALRPVSREQVERMRGEWIADKYGDHSCSRCGIEADILEAGGGSEHLSDYCPSCGAPMTDEAVDMVMERLEEMKNG